MTDVNMNGRFLCLRWDENFLHLDLHGCGSWRLQLTKVDFLFVDLLCALTLLVDRMRI